MARAAEYRDNETGMHVIRISKLCERLAKGVGLGEHQCNLIRHASPMHDIGKIGIPDHILLKSGKLTAKEWAIMKSHADIGALILSGSESEFLQMAEVIAGSHHEKYDGTGYPNGLKGENIPLGAQIIAVADFFEAITSRRHYRDPMQLKKAFNLLQNESGKRFNSAIVDAFCNYYSRKHAGEPVFRAALS